MEGGAAEGLVRQRQPHDLARGDDHVRTGIGEIGFVLNVIHHREDLEVGEGRGAQGNGRIPFVVFVSH